MADIIFVPLWLERHLKSLGCSVTVLSNRQETANILSPIDLGNYMSARHYFEQTYLVPQGLAERCELWWDVSQSIDDRAVCAYLYGNTFVGAGLDSQPNFDVNVMGDSIYVTVPDQLDTSEFFVPGVFVRKLVSALVNYMPLEQIARTALYRNFVTAL